MAYTLHFYIRSLDSLFRTGFCNNRTPCIIFHIPALGPPLRDESQNLRNVWPRLAMGVTAKPCCLWVVVDSATSYFELVGLNLEFLTIQSTLCGLVAPKLQTLNHCRRWVWRPIDSTSDAQLHCNNTFQPESVEQWERKFRTVNSALLLMAVMPRMEKEVGLVKADRGSAFVIQSAHSFGKRCRL